MNSLVSQYSRSSYEQNEPLDEQDELLNSMGGDLSIKFAMPPVAQVGH